MIRNTLPPKFNSWLELYESIKDKIDASAKVVEFSYHDMRYAGKNDPDGGVIIRAYEIELGFMYEQLFKELYPYLFTANESHDIGRAFNESNNYNVLRDKILHKANKLSLPIILK